MTPISLQPKPTTARRIQTTMTSTTLRTTSAAFIGMASFMPFHGSRPASAMSLSPDDIPIVCVAEKHDFTIQQLRGGGRYIIVHFLPSQPHQSQHPYIQSVLSESATLAGVMHLFVRTDSPEPVEALAAHFGKRPAQFALDTGGKLAAEFKLANPARPAVIALDPDGAELFRRVGNNETDLPKFADIRSQLVAAWSLPSRNHYNLPPDSSLAINGYDPVAYFTESKANKGDERFTADYRGVTYRFANEANRRRFVVEPTRYLPTYGGWCASAIGAKGEKVGIDPTNFKVKDGRLFLFYKGLFADALKDWNKHEREWEPAADANWKKIAGE